jgi:hypothetical protein
MVDPHLVDVAYADGHWLAEAGPYFEGQFDLPTLMQIITAVQKSLPAETFVFVVDQSTVEDYEDAEAQVLEASEKSGALVISSVQVF